MHGYVLICMVFAQEVPLTSLRLIRGLALFKPLMSPDDPAYTLSSVGFSLYVASNTNHFTNPNTGIGLHELQLPGLQGNSDEDSQC